MRSRRSAFTLIELLVVIAIIAILSVVVVLTLNPAELLRQSRDANRVSDMDTLTHALGIYSEDVGTGLGSSNVVYVSLPDSTATSSLGDQCQGLGLPIMPSNYSYHCTNSTYNRNVDGTGWIPVNFKSISSGAPIGNLPVDPTNVSSTRLYYTYTTNGTTYEMTNALESQKYKIGGSNDVITGDGGSKASVYEKGTNLTLEPVDYGDTSLVGDWSFDEGSSSIVYDYSGNNATGTWNGTPTGTAGYYSGGEVGSWAGAFDGTTDYVNVATNSAYQFTGPFTVSVWEDITATTTQQARTLVSCHDGSHGYILAISYSGGKFSPRFTIFNTGASYTDWNGTSGSIVSGTWMQVVGVYDGTNLYLYVNGTLNTQHASVVPAVSPTPLRVGYAARGGFDYFAGLIDDVRIYNRALSAAEIQSLYNGGK